MKVVVTFSDSTFKRLGEMSDKVMYAFARATLDMTGVTHATPYKSGDTETSMFSRGVQPTQNGYCIGNFTSYAERVYALDSANWSNKLTQPHWFHSILDRYGDMMLENCVKRYKL